MPFLKFIIHNIVAARFRDVHTDVKGLGSFNPDVTTSSAILPTIFLWQQEQPPRGVAG